MQMKPRVILTSIFHSKSPFILISSSSRIIEIQSVMAERCIQLLNLPNHPCLILDIGCGSGLSGEMLTEYEHMWVGLDISEHMLS